MSDTLRNEQDKEDLIKVNKCDIIDVDNMKSRNLKFLKDRVGSEVNSLNKTLPNTTYESKSENSLDYNPKPINEPLFSEGTHNKGRLNNSNHDNSFLELNYFIPNENYIKKINPEGNNYKKYSNNFIPKFNNKNFNNNFEFNKVNDINFNKNKFNENIIFTNNIYFNELANTKLEPFSLNNSFFSPIIKDYNLNCK